MTTHEQPIGRDCALFRERLISCLAGPPHVAEQSPASSDLKALAWHEHLTTCADCKSLLNEEEALELLLASLPEPQLPADLARRVLARLARTRRGEEVVLDRLLDLDDAAVAPAGLAARVLAGVGANTELEEGALDRVLARDAEVEVPAGLAARVLGGVRSTVAREEAALDALLDRAGQVDVPAGLATRVTAYVQDLEPEKTGVQLGKILQLRTWSPAFRAAAAVLLLAIGVVQMWPDGGGSAGLASGDEADRFAEIPDEEFLASLDALEFLELLEADADDPALVAFSGLSSEDLALLELLPAGAGELDASLLPDLPEDFDWGVPEEGEALEEGGR